MGPIVYGALDISKDLEAREQPFKTTTGTELGRAVARSAQLDLGLLPARRREASAFA